MLALVLLASLTGGCSAHVKVTRTVTVHSPPVEPTTPEATVLAYYRAVGHHDWPSAAAVLDPSLLAGMAGASVGDRNNIVRLDHVHVVRITPVALPQGLPRNYGHIMLAFVTYDVTYKQVEASNNGRNDRFVYLGQEATSGHWRILEIGTGP